MSSQRSALTLVLFILLSTPLHTRAQELTPLTGYRISSWMEEDGLPLGTIWALAQDKEGFLWIGADSGLVRFDGARFRTWQELGGGLLPRGSIAAIAVAADGAMWVGFSDSPHISRIHGRDITTYGPAQGINAQAITALAEDRAGTMWAGTSSGILQFSGDTWKAPSGGVTDGIVALAVSATGDLYAATETAIFRRPAVSDAFTRIGSSSAVVQSLAVDTSDHVWVTDRDIGYRALGADPVRRPRVPRGKGYRLLFDSKGHLWVATYGHGVWQVQFADAQTLPRVQSITDVQGLSNDVIYALLEDRDGNIWVGTTAGLNRLAPQRITQLRDLGVVTGIEVTSPDTVWANTADGLARFSLRNGAWIESGRDPTHMHADALHADHAGALWIATNAGVERVLVSEAGQPRERVSTSLRQVKSITSGRDGTVWIFDVERGLYRWNAGHLAEVPLPPEINGRRISVFVDGTNRLWFGFPGQSTVVSVTPNGSLRMFGPAEGFAAGSTRMFYEDRDGILWVAGAAGLSRFANDRFVTLKRDAHLPLDSLTGIAEDDLGRLWLGTTSGILRISKAGLDAALRGQWDDVAVTTFGAADGVAGTTGWIGQPSAVRSGDGRLWFLTANGITILDPRSLQDRASNAPVRVDVVSIDGQPFPVGTAMTIRPGASRLQVEFTVPTLSPAQQTRFRYRLDGFDTAWINAGRLRTATYTNLPPRDYRFQVQLQEANGTWRERSATWAFSVQPAFYQTPWFMGTSAIVCVALGWMTWRFRVRQVRRQLAILHGERARLSREIHDTLLQSLVGVALQCDALANTPERASVTDGLLDLRRQVEGYVRECRQSLWNLRSPLLDEHDLATSLRQVAERATKTAGIALDLVVSGQRRRCPGRIDEQLLRIGQEAVTNAVRHSHATHVRLRLDYSATAVALMIFDNGIGFDPGDPKHAASGHWGLVGMQERAKAAKGTFSITSRLKTGTEIVVTVPLPASDPTDGENADHRALHRRPSDRPGGHRADHQPAA